MSKFIVVEDLNTCYTYGAYKYTSATKNIPYPAETNGFLGHGNILVLSSEYQEMSTQNMWTIQILYDNWGHIYRRIFNWHSWSNWTQLYPDYTNKINNSPGYIVFTNGLIIQYGRNVTVNYTNNKWQYNLPISFLSAYTTIIIPRLSDGYFFAENGNNDQAFTFTVYSSRTNNFILTGTTNINFIAIGQ